MSFENVSKFRLMKMFSFFYQETCFENYFFSRPRNPNDTYFFTIFKNSQKQRKATVGKQTTKTNYMTLDPRVSDDQSIFHTLLHVVGLLHEHQRPDRHNYVTVHLANIPYVHDRQFKQLNRSRTFGPYDPSSIMHYKYLQGSTSPNHPTITSKVCFFVSYK